MPGPSHRQAGLPRPLADEIIQLMDEHPELGFSSLGSFATAACREMVREIRRDLYYEAFVESRGTRRRVTKLDLPE